MKRFVLPALSMFSLLSVATMAQAATLQDAQTLVSNAQQLRAAEFSPSHYAKARQALEDAQKLSASQGDPNAVMTDIATAVSEAQKASQISQFVSTHFADLVGARDRMELAGTKNMRQDLLERAEKDFSHVVADVEDDNMHKANEDAKIAMGTVHAALVVAARRRFGNPLAKFIAGARRVNSRKFAPLALGKAVNAQQKLAVLIRTDPNNQVQAYAISQRGIESATRAIRIARLGNNFERNPASVETWMDTEDGRLRMLGTSLGIQLSRTQTPEQQVSMLKQAVQDLRTNYEGRISDADAQIKQLSDQLTQSQNKLAQSQNKLNQSQVELSDLAAIRHKLEIRREAEAKIKRLTKLFDPNAVDILLTPDADVILRLKGLNFRSGSAAIPPNSYTILDHVIQSITLFPKRAVRVEGNTDSVGSDKFNKVLSARRAQAVENYLTNRMDSGTPHTFTAIGYGKDKPIAVNDTPEGRAKNRRIDIVLVAPKVKEGSTPQATAAPSAPATTPTTAAPSGQGK